jgi:putative glycosyltransferase (TIGR04372 family)
MALHVRRYEEENNPQYMAKELSLESIGDQLAPVVDFLRSQKVPVMMVGSADTGRSQIRREMPRLSDFGQLGGPEEVALASTCRYFWTDNVGAWWLAAPFKRPVLFTNYARFKMRTGHVPYGSMCLPTIYETPDGARLTFRDILKARSSPHKAASRGELRMVRNSPDEMINAHQEMLDRLSGSWLGSDETMSLARRLEAIMSEFPKYEPWRIPTGFLAKHSYLLE